MTGPNSGKPDCVGVQASSRQSGPVGPPCVARGNHPRDAGWPAASPHSTAEPTGLGIYIREQEDWAGPDIGKWMVTHIRVTFGKSGFVFCFLFSENLDNLGVSQIALRTLPHVLRAELQMPPSPTIILSNQTLKKPHVDLDTSSSQCTWVPWKCLSVQTIPSLHDTSQTLTLSRIFSGCPRQRAWLLS